VHAQGLLARLYRPPDLAALTLLPIEPATIFGWEFQKHLRASLMLLADLLAGYGVVAVSAGFSSAGWAAIIPVAILNWATVTALAALGSAYRPGWPYPIFSFGFMIVVVGLFLARNVVETAFISALDHWAVNINLGLPTGWSVSLFGMLVESRPWLSLGLLVPLAAIIWSLRASVARLQSSYDFKEVTVEEQPDLVPGDETQVVPVAAREEQQALRLGETAIAEIVQRRQFFQAPAWHTRGWFENRLWQWLNRREKVLSEFVFPDGLRITRSWMKITRNLAMALVAGVAAGMADKSWAVWIISAGLFITFCQALAQILATGRAFQLLPSSGQNVPAYAVLPVGFRELGTLLFKCTLIQGPLLLPFMTICGAAISWLADFPLALGALAGCKAGFLVMAGRFIALTFSFSSGTNDSATFRLRTLALFMEILVVGLSFMGLGLASLLVPSQSLAFLCLAGAAIASYAFFRIYGWFYHRMRLDLVNPPRR
jgi:hypothetical protein